MAYPDYVSSISSPTVVIFVTALFFFIFFFNTETPFTSIFSDRGPFLSRLEVCNLNVTNTTELSPESRRIILAQAEEVYQKNLKIREESKILTRKTIHDSETYYIRPVYPCPLEARLGSWKDGGKWMCLLPPYAKNGSMVVYSIGCNGVTSFEHDVWKTFNTKTYTFDPTLRSDVLSNVQKTEFLNFFNIGLTGSDDVDKALKDLPRTAPGARMMQIDQIMKMLGHDFVDVFKIDCEGCEMEVFQKLSQIYSKEKPFFGQILIETHNYPNYVHKRKLLEMIESMGYRMFHAEPNFYCRACFEFGYIHESLVKVE